MIALEHLGALVDGDLDAATRDALEKQFERDPESLAYVTEQRRIDILLRSLLAGASHREQLAESILAAVAAQPVEMLEARVLSETSGEVSPAPATPYPSVRDHLRRLRGVVQRWKRLRIAAALAVGGVMLFAAAFWWTSAPTPGPEIGRFTGVVGTPFHVTAGPRPGAAGILSSIVRLGDRIETGDADRADLQFLDGTTLQLGFNTVVQIPIPPGARSAASALTRPPEVELVQGQVWTRVQKGTNSTPYALRTVAATALARGTEFGVKLNRPKAAPTGGTTAATHHVATLTVKEGEVDFFNAFGSVRATAMTESTAAFGSAPTEPKRLQTVRSARLDNGAEPWNAISSPLEAWEAGLRLAGGAGYAGVFLQTQTNAAGAGASSEVVVTQVASGSPAERAGLRPADVLLHLDGRPVTNLHRVIAAIRLQPTKTLALTVRTGAEERSVILQPAHQPNEMAGPALDDHDAARLTELMEQWLEQTPQPPERDRLAQASQVSKDERLQGAAHNNLGVLYELEDAFGPALRAYGRAVRLQPRVALYRFNLGMALRKMGSLERAAEELEIAQRLAPQSVNAGQWYAEVLSMLGRHEEADERLGNLLLQHPEHHGLWELKARLLSSEHLAGDATEAARKAVETAPDCAVARSYLGGALMREGKALEAEQEYRKAVEFAPFSAEMHLHHGLALNMLDRGGEAETAIRKALELQPDFQLAWRNLGGVLGDRGQWEQAAAALRKAAELDPEDVAVLRDFGRLAVKQGRLGQAEIHFLRALAAAPDAPESYSDLGTVQADGGQRTEAERTYLKGIALHPRNPVLREHLAAVYLGLGLPEKAVEFYRKALELAPSRSSPYNGLAQLLAERGDLDEAERLLRQAAEFAPDDPRTHNNLGMVLLMRGRLDEAATAFRRVLQTNPADPAAYHNLGVIRARQGNFAEAEEIFRTLVDRSRRDGRIPPLLNLIHLGNVCSAQGKLQEAEQAYRDALAIDPDRSAGLNRLAWFLAEHQLHLDEALVMAHQAVQLQPGNPSYLDTLGWVHFQRGELADAEAQLQAALRLTPSASTAAEIREHLRRIGEHKAARQ